MPSLTVTEKEHWKERIGKRIAKKIEILTAGDPCLLVRVSEQARLRALQSLGLADMQVELDAIAKQKEELQEREQLAHRRMLAHVRREPIDEVTDLYYGRMNSDVTSAVQKRQAIHEDELLAESDLGREILRLRQEKENLLDTVWLATSPTQIRDLWQKVIDLLGEEQTALQKEAMAIRANGTSE
jgi:hypothetical protein